MHVRWRRLCFNYSDRVICSFFNERFDEIVYIGLALIVYELLSVLTLMAEEIVPIFGIDSLRACARVDIDS